MRRLERALALLEAEAADIAVLEVRLDGRSAAPLAAALRARGLPFVLVTGYAEPPEPVFHGASRVAKPFRADELLGAVTQTIGAHR